MQHTAPSDDWTAASVRHHPAFRLALGGLCAIWLYAWLPTMEQLGVLRGAGSFTWVLVVLALGQAVRWRWLRGAAAVLVSALYVVYWYGPSHGMALSRLGQASWAQLGLALGGSLEDPFQTELFLLILCALFWLVTYAVKHPRLWAFYTFLSVLVLGIIDGNTDVHPNGSIVTQLVLFVAVLGLLQFHRFSSQLIWGGRPVLRFFVPLAALLAVACGVGLSVPKPGPVWADPLARFDHGHNGAGPGLRQIGYQMDNSRLGGSFVQNHTPVLAVVTKNPVYLRGQVFTYYTGHGWLPPNPHTQTVAVHQPLLPDARQVIGELHLDKVTAHITVLSNSLHVPIRFTPYEASEVTADSAANPGLGVDFTDDTITGAPLRQGETYTVQSEVLEPPDAVLAALPALPADHASAFPTDIQLNDLQLPSSLPPEVRELAVQLTQGMTSEYDMVEAIENYLKFNYTYATDGIPVPGRNQDYVDQFLFDTKKGYCNNFSSAMAVLLRSIGIPTRWVTGFAPGTMDPAYQGSEDRFVVTNADAHSWVEVYFPVAGWIPFDPTPNFDMTFSPAPVDNPPTPAPAKPQPPLPPAKLQPPTPPSTTGSAAATPTVAWGRLAAWAGGVAGAIVLVGLLLLWRFRYQVQDWHHLRRWRRDTPDEMTAAVQHLLRLLRHFGELRRPSPTLRDLAGLARAYDIGEAEFRQLVQTFEQLAYGTTPPATSAVQDARETWRTWVRRILQRGR